jgi:hypothetical protein
MPVIRVAGLTLAAAALAAKTPLARQRTFTLPPDTVV